MSQEKDGNYLDPNHFSQDTQRKKLSHSHDRRRRKNKDGGNTRARASWEERRHPSQSSTNELDESEDCIDGLLQSSTSETQPHVRQKSASLPQNLKTHEFKRLSQLTPSSNLFSPHHTSPPLETEEEHLYCQVLQTVVNPLGAPDFRDGYRPQDLAKHLRKVFEIDQNVHSKYVQYVQKNKPSNVVLNVTVIEACNMRAMDADGFSDPYCILDLVKSSKGSPMSSPHGSPSQRRKYGSLNSIDSSLDGDTTAKKTKIKNNTLNPRWNETFELEVRNLSQDELVIVFWDYDEAGILDSVKTMDKHHGIKTLYRQLKQHMEMGKQTDDFMGYIQIPLRDIPASGSEEWHDIRMDRKGSKGKLCGKCKLKLELSVKHVSLSEDVDELDSPESDQCSIEEYYMAVKKFYRYNMKETQEKQLGSSRGEVWELSEHCRMILRQFAVQNHIQTLSQSLMELVVILELLVDETRACNLSDKLLKDMIVNIEMECLTAKTSADESSRPKSQFFLPLTKTEQKMFERAAGDYLEKTIRVLDELPNMFPPKELDLDILSTKISLMVSILNLHIWKCIDHNDMEEARKDVSSLLVLRIQDDVKAYIQSLMEKIEAKCVGGKDPELMETRHFVSMLQDLMTLLNPTYSLSQYFARVGVDYFKVVSISAETKVAPKAKFLVHQLEAYLVKYQKFHVNVKEVSGLSLQLYFSLTRFSSTVKNNLPERESFKLSVLHFQSWFETSVMFWLQTFREECIQRMHKALEIEKDVVQVTALVKYSNSALDVMACFSKITAEWKMIDFKDADIQLLGVTKITDTLCDGASQYANKVEYILENNGYYDWNDNAQFDVTDQLCITLNNIEYVRNYLGELKELLKFDEIAKAMVEKHELPDLEGKTLHMLTELVQSATDDIKHNTTRILDKITDKMSVDLMRYINKITQHKHEMKDFDALLDYLDANLEVLYEKLSSSVFPVILKEIWNTVLNTMERNLQSGEKPEYYQQMKKHLQAIQAYFDKGQCGDDGTYSTQYLNLRNKIELQSLSTEELILKHMSYLSSTKYQGADSCGSLTVKCAHVKETGGIICVLVKVMQANGLPGANKNGLSDPQVTLTLVPQTMFTPEPMKTKKAEKTVDPVFEELLEFPPVMQDTAQTPGASVVFSVWNCNIVLSNEFLGEAVLEIKDIPDLGNKISVDYLAATILQLRKPNNAESEAFQVLQDRSNWDKAAVAFIKHRESMTGTVGSPIKTVLNSFLG